MTKLWLVRPLPWHCPYCRAKQINSLRLRKDGVIEYACDTCTRTVYGEPTLFEVVEEKDDSRLVRMVKDDHNRPEVPAPSRDR